MNFSVHSLTLSLSSEKKLAGKDVYYLADFLAVYLAVYYKADYYLSFSIQCKTALPSIKC